MDLTIEVVIAVFVAVVVGGAILLFSQRTITKGELGLATIGDDKEAGITIVKLSAGSTLSDLKNLAESCAAANINGVEKKDCFVVKGTIPASYPDLDGTHTTGGKLINLTATGDPNALFISYDPRWIEISS